MVQGIPHFVHDGQLFLSGGAHHHHVEQELLILVLIPAGEAQDIIPAFSFKGKLPCSFFQDPCIYCQQIRLSFIDIGIPGCFGSIPDNPYQIDGFIGKAELGQGFCLEQEDLGIPVNGK